MLSYGKRVLAPVVLALVCGCNSLSRGQGLPSCVSNHQVPRAGSPLHKAADTTAPSRWNGTPDDERIGGKRLLSGSSSSSSSIVPDSNARGTAAVSAIFQAAHPTPNAAVTRATRETEQAEVWPADTLVEVHDDCIDKVLSGAQRAFSRSYAESR